MKDYLKYIQSLPCCVMYQCEGDVVAHHIEAGGMGMKCSDLLTVPLCHFHHREIHQQGRTTFAKMYQTDLYKSSLKNLIEFINKNNIDIKVKKITRSTAQNSLYWMWLNIVGDEIGYTSNEIHEIFAWKFLPPIIVDAMGEKIEIRQSTAKLNTKEFSEYLDKIERFVIQELCIVLPRPDDLYLKALLKD